MNVKYILGAVVTIPLLPFMYLDGKRIRKNVPKLSEAKEPQGKVHKNTNRELQVLVLGESTVAGVGVNKHEEGFTGTFAKILANKLTTTVNWKVYARSGYTAALVRKKIIPKITERQADIIIIGLGGNDAFTLNTPNKWKKEILALIKELRALYPKTPIAFTNMPPIKEFPAFTALIKFTVGNLVEILGQELENLTSNLENVYYNSEIITIKKWTQRLKLDNDPSDFFSDGVHPSKLTYQAWAKDFCDFIVKKNDIFLSLKQSTNN